MAARSKAWVCGRSLAEIVGSNPTGEAWMFVCCECYVLSGRVLCDELITRPEESYRLWCVVVCDLGNSRIRRPWPALGRSAIGKKKEISCLVGEFDKNENPPATVPSVDIQHKAFFTLFTLKF